MNKDKRIQKIIDDLEKYYNPNNGYDQFRLLLKKKISRLAEDSFADGVNQVIKDD